MADIKPELGNDICRKAIRKWGMERQLDMCAEECSELIKALLKYRRHNHDEDRRVHCVEEAVDLSIMIDQLVILVSSQDEFDRIRRYKLRRLSKMVDGGMERQTCENSERDAVCEL